MPVPLPLLAQLWLAAADPVPSELAPGEVGAVELSWAEVKALREAVTDEAPAPGPWVAEREIDLRPAEGGLWLEGRWTIVAKQAGWLTGELLGPGIELRSATLGGRTAPVVALPGSTLLAAWIEGGRTVELRVRAFVPGGLDQDLALGLLPATRGRLRAAVPGRVVVPVIDEGEDGRAAGHAAPARLEGGVVWSGTSQLHVRLRDPASVPPPTRETLAVAHVGMGLTVGDAEVRGRAHVQWELRQGELSRVRATISGVGDDLTVEGTSVATWSRSGDVLDVELSAPTTGRVDLELRWTQAIGGGEETRLPLPRIEPDAWRSESSLQLARDGELEVIPEVEQGTAIAAAALPEWGQGLVEGTPTAAYEHGGGASSGHLDLLRFVPVPGPPAVVDVADYTVATTDEGRVLMKARYELRNDRAAHLIVRPPPGLRIIGARVGRDTALPSHDEDGAWRIPLRRSLETVDGLLSFPVEVILLGEQEAWERRERRELPLPTLDAPIAAARVTLFLPPRYRSRLEAGERNVVDAFDEGEGLAYGRGVGSDEQAAADVLLDEAVQGYLQNDFEGAQEKLAQIEALGVDNANVARLRSNIEVIEGKEQAQDKADVTLQRRVKEQAKARASEDFRRQEALIAEAEQAAQAGDYAQAETQYQAALDLGGKLAKLEQAESVEQQTRNVSVEAELSSVSKKKGKRGSFKKAANTREPGAKDAEVDEDGRWASADSFGSADAKAPAGSGAAPNVDPPTGVPASDITGILDPSAVVNLPRPAADPAPAAEDASGEQVLASRREPLLTTTFGDESPLEGIPVEPSDPSLEEPIEPTDMPAMEIEEEPEDSPELLADAPAARGPRLRARRGNRLDTKFKAEGRAARGRVFARRGNATTTDTATSVYDFEDDNVDGEVLRPEGAMLSSRSAPSAPIERLPPPEVTASALSVVVPVTGQAVLYQQLLIEANQTQVIEIDARRRLRR